MSSLIRKNLLKFCIYKSSRREFLNKVRKICSQRHRYQIRLFRELISLLFSLESSRFREELIASIATMTANKGSG